MAISDREARIAQEAIKMAIEETAKIISAMAVKISEDVDGMTGREALVAFSLAILETSKEFYPHMMEI